MVMIKPYENNPIALFLVSNRQLKSRNKGENLADLFDLIFPCIIITVSPDIKFPASWVMVMGT